MFTLDELNQMTKDQLIKLATYYKLEFSKYWIKSKIIGAIQEHTTPREEDPKKYPYPMSVRQRRIYDASNKE